MTTIPRIYKLICRPEVESCKGSQRSNATATPPSRHQKANSEDLIIARKATDNPNKSLDRLTEEYGCTEFLATHRLLERRYLQPQHFADDDRKRYGHKQKQNIKLNNPIISQSELEKQRNINSLLPFSMRLEGQIKNRITCSCDSTV